jgi:hypothetical protein
MALSHLGIDGEIANVLTEKSPEANACRRFYSNSLAVVLGEFPWPFATRFATLELVEEDPTDEWAYSYRYPSGCLYIHRILSGIREDYQGSRVEFRISSDATGLLILTDQEDAQVEYGADITDTALFPADFNEALSYRIAASIAPRLTGGDPFKLGDKAMQMYRMTMAAAKAGSVNEEQLAVPVDSEFVRVRD